MDPQFLGFYDLDKFLSLRQVHSTNNDRTTPMLQTLAWVLGWEMSKTQFLLLHDSPSHRGREWPWMTPPVPVKDAEYEQHHWNKPQLTAVGWGNFIMLFRTPPKVTSHGVRTPPLTSPFPQTSLFICWRRAGIQRKITLCSKTTCFTKAELWVGMTYSPTLTGVPLQIGVASNYILISAAL